MDEELLFSLNQCNCIHWQHRKYVERGFDVLNGFEVTASRCSNCYKILEIKIRKLGKK